MAIKIQVIEKKKQTESLIKQVNTEINNQIITHHDEIVALHFTAELQPNMILLDYQISGQNTADLISFLFQKAPDSKIIVLGNKLSQEQILTCLLAGANGYLENRFIELHINKAIQVVLAGEIWITRKMTAVLLERLRNY
jgi:DNA-binding NarL/FixJ family response regulator